MHQPDKKATYRREFTTVDYVHAFDVDIEKRDIFLFGREEYASSENDEEMGIEWTIANRFIKNLRVLSAMGDGTILVHMKTNGGSWIEGMAMYDAIKSCHAPVVVLNYSHARSMSSIILQAADWRAMMPHSHFMYHDGSDGFEGTTKQFFSYAEWSKRTQEQMLNVYAPRLMEAPAWAGKSKRQVVSHLRRQMSAKEEVYLSAEEAVEQGFADEVFGKDGRYDWVKLRSF